MTAHHDHPLPQLGCYRDSCATWSDRMLADDDRSLEELVLTIERATTTLALRHGAGTLTTDDVGALSRPARDALAVQIGRLVTTSTTLRQTSSAVFRRHVALVMAAMGATTTTTTPPTTMTEETDRG